jgi:hypothetical protein
MINAALKVVLESRCGSIRYKNESDLPTFSANTDFPRCEVEVLPIEASEFCKTKARTEKELEDSLVPLSGKSTCVWRIKKAFDLLRKEHFHLPRILLEALHAIGGVDIEFFFLNEISEESS